MSDAKIEQVKELIEEYQRLRTERLSEADVCEALVARLFRALGWKTDSPLEWNRQKFIREGGYADVALQIDNKPVIFLEAKKLGKIRRAEAERQPLLAVQQSLFDSEWVPSTAQRIKRAGDRTPEEKQALRYARADVKVKWAILTNFERLLLFDADEERIILAFDAPQAYVDRFDDLKLLQRDQVAEGALDWYKGQLKKAEIDEGFYDFLLEWRKRLAQDVYDEDKNRDKRLFQPTTEEKLDLLGQAVQRTLDRLIIIRYADDVGALLQHDQLERILTSYQAQGPYAVEYDLQQDVNTFYRAFYREHDTAIFASPHICEEVLISNKTMEALLGDLTNISFRKFTSDILGNTYESYLGHKLKLVGDKIELEARRELRKGKGIYYTPTYIVRYIVDNTLGKYLYGTVDGKVEGEPEEGATRKTLADISDLRVLDPAMGSGSFLIYGFDVLADFYERENKRIEEENAAKWDRWGKEQLQKGMFGKDNETPTLQATEPNYIEKILQEHLYGVDLDREAVEIAGVNLIMRAFDRLKNGPSREQRKLPLILHQNLKVGNSLISGGRSAQDLERHREAITELIEGRKELTQLRGDEERNKKLAEIEAIAKPVKEALNANLEKYFGDEVEANQPFNWQVEFPEVFAGGGFDIVIGNPPYVRPHKLDEDFKRFLWGTYPTIEAKSDIYAGFMTRAIDLLKLKGAVSYIVSNTWLSLESFAPLRAYILDKCAVSALAVPPRRVFEDATVETIVFTFRREQAAQLRSTSNIKYCEYDDDAFKRRKVIPQRLFETTYLNVFDLSLDTFSMNLTVKVTQGSIPLDQCIVFKYGLKTADDAKFLTFNAASAQHKKLLRRSDFDRYKTLYRGEYVWYVPAKMRQNKPTARPGEPDRFEQPKILVLDIAKRLVATLDVENYYVKDALLLLLKSSAFQLRYVLALLNSKLLNYIFNKTFATLSVAKNAILTLPIHVIDFSNPQDKSRHDNLLELTQRMLDLNAAKQKTERAFTETLKGYEREYVSLWKAYYDHSEYRGTHIECQPLIDANEKGEVTGIRVDENPDTQSLQIASKVDDQWCDIARLNIASEDFRLFLFFGLRAFLQEKRRKKIWARGKILRGILEALQVPVLVVAKADLNIKRIKQFMDEFERKCPSEALHLSQLEATLRDTDAQIDDLVYDLYGITAEEREIIEASLR